MPTFIVELSFDQDEEYRLRVRPAHREYLTGLTAAGRVRLAGPVADGSGAVLVYDVADRAELDGIVAEDPYFAGPQPAATVTNVREWGVLDLGPRPTSQVEDLLAALAQQRTFLRGTLEGLTHAQAGARPTPSQLCLGGIVKHVSATERGWVRFIEQGASAFADDIDWTQVDWENPSPAAAAKLQEREAEFSMLAPDSVEDILAEYEQTAAETERVLRNADPELAWELPPAPWNEPGARWSARRVAQHILAETAHHTGHADIIREAIDGRKTMG